MEIISIFEETISNMKESPDIVIYHKADLDGLACGSIMLQNFETKGSLKVIGYDYGEDMDVRVMKNKYVVIADVSLPIEKMFSMGRVAKTLYWIDHHISQLEELMDYCKKNQYKVEEFDFNEHIKMFQIRKKENGQLLMTKLYSDKLSACEIMAKAYSENLSADYLNAISLLGQYDTWRNTPGKQILTDSDWDTKVLPFQYGMRTNETLFDVKEYLNALGDWRNSRSISETIKVGKGILKYQDSMNAKSMKNAFEVEIGRLKGIAFNGGPFNSQTFKTVWDEEKYDFMMPFSFRGEKWNFSLYTTKDVNILKIAKGYGGGGHAKACGFQLDADKVQFEANKVIILSE